MINKDICSEYLTRPKTIVSQGHKKLFKMASHWVIYNDVGDNFLHECINTFVKQMIQ